MELTLNLNQLFEMVHIPGMYERLSECINKWDADGIGECRVEYRLKKLYYYRTLFEKPEHGEQLYWFELNHHRGRKWMVDCLEPRFPGDQDAFQERRDQALPGELIGCMTDSVVDPDTIIVKENCWSKSFGRRYDLHFVRISATFICGIIWHRNLKQTRFEQDLNEAYSRLLNYSPRFPVEVGLFVKSFTEKYCPPADIPSSPPPRPIPASGKGNIQPPSLDPAELRALEKQQSIDIDKLVELWRIPHYNRLLKLKFEELKGGVLKKEADSIKKWKAYHYRTLFKQRKGEMVQWFVLTRSHGSNWEITDIVPWPKMFQAQNVFLPAAVKDRLAAVLPVPARVHEDKFQRWVELPVNTNVRWVRLSLNCIVGTVLEFSEMTEKLDEIDLSDQKNVLALLKKCSQLHSFVMHVTLSRHIHNNPEVARRFVHCFNTELLPKLKTLENRST